MSEAGTGSSARRRIAAAVAVAGLISFLYGSIGFSTEIGQPSGDPTAADAILQAGFVEFSLTPAVCVVVAIATAVGALLVARRDGPGAAGGFLAGLGIWVLGSLGGVLGAWLHGDLAPAPAGWALVSGPVLIALAGVVAGDGGRTATPARPWIVVGVLAVALARFVPAVTRTAGAEIPALAPGDDAVGLAALVLVVAAAALHLSARGSRAFLAGGLLAVGLAEVTFGLQGLAIWGPSPFFAVGPATFLRIAGGAVLLWGVAKAVRRRPT